MLKIKNEEMCERFNGFIHHIEERHSKKIYQIMSEKNFQLEYIFYPLNDVILEKLKIKLDDDHYYANLFEERLEYWSKNIKSHEL